MRRRDWGLTQGTLTHADNKITDLRKLKGQVVWMGAQGGGGSRQREQEAERPRNRAVLQASQKQQGWCGRSVLVVGGAIRDRVQEGQIRWPLQAWRGLWCE